MLFRSERIECEMKKKGLNFKRLERECSLGNGTIKRWNEQSPRLDKLVVVSEYLQTSLDYLVFGRECSLSDKACCLGAPLTQYENDFIAMLRALPLRDRDDLFDFVQLKYRKHVERKSEPNACTSYSVTDEAETA